VPALGKQGVGRMVQVSVWHENVDSKELLDHAIAFKTRYGVDWARPRYGR
jgi:hypothetical protein